MFNGTLAEILSSKLQILPTNLGIYYNSFSERGKAPSPTSSKFLFFLIFRVNFE